MAQFSLIIFSLFFMSNTSFAQIMNNSLDGDGKKSTLSKPRPLSDSSEDNIVDIDQQEDDLSPQEIAELEFIFEHSPQKAQVIVNHLTDPNYFPHNKDYRSAYFVGEPGSGKTTMARAIAYKMSKKGWDYKFIGSTELVGGHRDQTARQLKEELQKVVASKRPTIVVIDELHRLLENTESKHHDTDTAATALWLFLDKQRNNQNFFLIGTMNRITKLPKPLKDRVLIDVVKFHPIDDVKIKNLLFRHSITSHNMSFDNAVTDEFLDTELAKLGTCFGRNLNKVSKLLFQIQRMDNKEKVMSSVVKKEIITKSIRLYIEMRNDMDYDFVEETDEERQNRHHIENMNVQKQHHRESQVLQDQHFVQQQIIQVISAQHTSDLITFLTSDLKSNRILDCLSNHQRMLLYQIAKDSKKFNEIVEKQKKLSQK